MKTFISYSSKDRDFVVRLATDLKQKGILVWLDEWEIKVGDEIRQKIEHGIAEYDYFVIVLSKHSVASTWVEKELNAAFMKEVSSEQIVILPVLLDKCPIPPLISGKKYADFTQSYETGLHALGLVLAPCPREIPRVTFRNVVIIADDVMFAQAVARFLQYDGLSVSVATTLEAGVELARHYQPDCVLLDIWVHPEFGTVRGGLIQELRRLSPASKLIGMTGAPTVDNGLNDLFDTVLCKPITREDLFCAMALDRPDGNRLEERADNVKTFEEQDKDWTSTKRVSARALNSYPSEKPHKCSYCGYSFSIMPKIEEGKSYFVKTATCTQCGNMDEVSKFYQIDSRMESGEKDDSDKIFIYLDMLYNDIGLFVRQYYDSDDLHNSQKSRSLHGKMEEFAPLLSHYKLSLSNKLINEITTFFEMLFSYKMRVESAVSRDRDETAYKRWLEINTDFGTKVATMIEGLKNAFKKQKHISIV